MRLLRELRDSDPDRFEEIKNLPKKARTARETHEEERSGLLTFFRWGDLKRFFLARDEAATELTFFEAAQAFECEPDARRIELPDDFYERLDRNKQAFEYSTSEEDDSSGPSGGFSNEERVMRRLRAKEVKNCKRLTDRDDEFRREVLRAFITGVIPENTTRRIKNRLENGADPLRALQILRDEIPESVLEAQRKRRSERQKGRREVILSAYLQAK